MSEIKSGTLYLVGTPIGNLEDITLRALRILREVDVIACEDTRHSLALLNHYEIKKPLVSYHKFNEATAGATLIDRLKKGENVALITDAGMPCISDPGSKIVRLAETEGVNVRVVPGASAVVSACALCGLESGFAFVGFLPDNKAEREKVLDRYRLFDMPLVFYVSPHDLTKDVESAFTVYGDREAYLVRELTKVYEEVLHDRLSALLETEARGEYVMIVMPAQAGADPMLALTLDEHILAYLGLGYSEKEAAKMVAKERGIARNEVYKRAIELKNGD